MFRRRKPSRWRSVGTWLLVMAAISAARETALSRRHGGSETASDGGVTIRGMGNSGNRISQDARAERLARNVAANEGADRVTDEELAAAWRAVVERAESGEMDAAAVVFEVARRQRASQLPE